MAYRLVAHGIGARTVRELIEGPSEEDEGMDTDEFLTWLAYFLIEPPIESRVDVLAGMMMAQQFNMHRGSNTPSKRASEFTPEWGRTTERVQTPDEMKEVLKAHFISMNGDPSQLT